MTQETTSFKDFVENNPTESPVIPETTDGQAVSEGTDASPATTEPTPAVAPQLTFESVLAQAGFEVPEEVDREALYQQVAATIRQYGEIAEENQRLRDQVAKASSVVVPSPQVPVAASASPPVSSPEPVKPERVRRFQSIKPYDASLLNFVSRNEHGVYVPKAEFGSVAIEAAKEINAIEKAKAQNAQVLTENPLAIVEDYLPDLESLVEAKAQKLLDERFKALQAEQEAAQQAAAQQRAQTVAEERIAAFDQAHKGELFVLDASGNPRTILGTNQPAVTTRGKAFFDKLRLLESRMPNADRVGLLEIAYELSAQEPVAPTVTTAEKKQKFLQQRQSPSRIPGQGVPAASVEQMASTGRVQFRDLAAADPEMASIMSSWQ